MVEHYSREAIERTAALYSKVLHWAENRGDVTIIGGWAVHHHVRPEHAMQSRDIDLVLHTEDAIKEVFAELKSWGLELRTHGRKTFPDAHFKDEDAMSLRVDIFTTSFNDTWNRRFGRSGLQNIKAAPRVLFPDLEWILHDKLVTSTKRAGTDASDKRAKDMIDVYNLVFQNKENIPAQVLLGFVDREVRHAACPYLDDAVKTRPEYSAMFDTLGEWLRS